MQIIAPSKSSCQSNPAVAGAERPARSLAAAAGNSSSAPLEVYTKSCLENKYDLHDLASRLLLDSRFHSLKEASLIQSNKLPRTSLCNKTPLLGGKKPAFVPVFKNLHHEGSAHFGGLLKCGSVWGCPICAEKISQGRTVELQRALDVWKSLSPGKNNHIMVSFTIPHKYYDSLEVLLKSFKDAKRAMKKQASLKKNDLKVWKSIKSDYHIFGDITGLECNLGGNGWHPHTHDILFLTRVLTHSDLLQLKEDITQAWLYACQQIKISIPNIEHFLRRSIHISISPTADEYISKFGSDFSKHKDHLIANWGHVQELTKSHIKRSRGDKGFTPWDLLRLIHQSDDQTIYNLYGARWREFVRVFSGSRQLFFSKGLKAFLKSVDAEFAAICEKKDQELAEHIDGKKELIGTLSADDWQIVLKYKLRGRVLITALRQTWSDVLKLIEEVQHGTEKKQKYKTACFVPG